MTLRLKILSAMLLLAGLASNAHAGFLIEPYLGYHTGEYEAGTVNNDVAGISYGARVGYKHMLGMMFGLDYMTGKWEDEATPNNDVTPSTLGVFIGFEFPVLLRVYGVYGLTNELKLKDSTSIDKYEGGSQLKLGVGYTGLPMVSINFEYITASFDELNGHPANPEVDSSLYGLTLSIPFDL